MVFRPGDRIGLRAGPLGYEPDSGRVWAGDRELELPPHLTRMLDALMRQPRRTFTRDQLLDRMYGGGTATTDRAVDQSVARLRRRLREPLGGIDVVESVYGLGYRLGRGLLEDGE